MAGEHILTTRSLIWALKEGKLRSIVGVREAIAEVAKRERRDVLEVWGDAEAELAKPLARSADSVGEVWRRKRTWVALVVSVLLTAAQVFAFWIDGTNLVASVAVTTWATLLIAVIILIAVKPSWAPGIRVYSGVLLAASYAIFVSLVSAAVSAWEETNDLSFAWTIWTFVILTLSAYIWAAARRAEIKGERENEAQRDLDRQHQLLIQAEPQAPPAPPIIEAVACTCPAPIVETIACACQPTSPALSTEQEPLERRKSARRRMRNRR